MISLGPIAVLPLILRIGGRWSGFSGRFVCRSSASSFGFDGTAPPVTLDVKFKDSAVMHQPVNGSQGHGWIGEELIPVTEGLIGGDEGRAQFVARTDQFKQDAGFGLVFGDVGEVIEDQQMVLVELVDSGFECEFAACQLQALHEVGLCRLAQ